MDGVEVNCGVCVTGALPGSARDPVGDGKISCDLTVCLSVRATRNETVSFLRDAYSTEAECATVTRDITVPVTLRAVLGNFSLNHTATLEESGHSSRLARGRCGLLCDADRCGSGSRQVHPDWQMPLPAGAVRGR